jgi:hypothetical protein
VIILREILSTHTYNSLFSFLVLNDASNYSEVYGSLELFEASKTVSAGKLFTSRHYFIVANIFAYFGFGVL